MPVTGLYFISEPTNPPALQILTDRLSKRHQPFPLARWNLEHKLLRENPPPVPATPTSPTTPQPTPQAPQHKFMQWLDLSYHPFMLFVLADKQMVTSEREFELIVRSKMAPMWTPRQTLRALGLGYEVDDFRVRIADLTQGDQMKGCIVEVEYGPCSYIEQGEAIIRDFVMGLDPPEGKFTFAPAEGYEKGKEWTVLDTGRQYCEVLRFR
ncbi:uncharacterized protein H6S33_002295 [Morchella sextelata]|uniref:uncharacterized protein n=1 Tax=Morchella sextelata TaxID=1174677 RepID=UPI001D05583D|nr:uncharacterized protein H6S33_002295 [Morchella sextelata]KAH0608243.1 hypothetical protein H6S33_002295 [Morchella sextelata]